MMGRFGIGGRSGKTGGAVYDPAVLDLTGFQREYAGAPWNGTASVGTSGTHSFTHATTPATVGANLNGHPTADFDGVDDLLVANAIESTFITANAWSFWCLLYARTVIAAPGATAPYATDGLLNDLAGSAFQMGISSAGFQAGYYDLSTWNSAIVACATGGWHLCQARGDGTKVEARVDSSGWSNVARNVVNVAGTLQIGKNYNAATFFDGLIADMGVSKLVLNDATFDNIKSYCNSRYALSL